MELKTEMEMDLNDLVKISTDALERFNKGNATEHDFVVIHRYMQGALRKVISISENAYFASQKLQDREIE